MGTSIIVIDRNDSIRLSITCFLEDYGYNILESRGGSHAIDLIQTETPDIIITDLFPSGINQVDILEWVKNNIPETPVIVVSGVEEIDLVVKALRDGAWDYIVKPIEDLNFLFYTIEKVIKRLRLLRENREKTQEIERKNIELRETIDTLNKTRGRLVEAEKMASLGYMVKGVAHEINTPLGICLTSTSYLIEKTMEIENFSKTGSLKQSSFMEYLTSMSQLSTLLNNSLKSINTLVNNFKQLSADQQETDLKSFTMAEVIKSILPISFKNNNKKITIKVFGDDPEIFSYPEIINRIFIKLGENTLIHGFKNKQEGNITVNISDLGDWVRVDYENNGNQIPENIIGRVFEPFVTQNKYEGTGLGLGIVYNLVNYKLMGEISCENIDSGVRFSLVFPKKSK
jgi:signal transduction histidine kinase